MTQTQYQAAICQKSINWDLGVTITKIILMLVLACVLWLVGAKVQESQESPFSINRTSYSCNGTECMYSVEVSNRRTSEKDGILKVSTYFITETEEGGINKKLLFETSSSFQLKKNQTKIVAGQYLYTDYPNNWSFVATEKK